MCKTNNAFVKYVLIIIFFIYSGLSYSYGQKKIILEHRTKSWKKKILNTERIYSVKTTDTTYFSKLINITDSTLSVVLLIKSGKDSSYIYSYSGKFKDTIITRPLYVEDTLAILFKDIQYFKKDWFKNNKWIEPFAWFIIPAALGIIGFPVAAIYGEIHDWLIFEGVLLGISFPPVLIGNGSTKYDLQKKWKIQTTDCNNVLIKSPNSP